MGFPRRITEAEAARRLDVSPEQVRRWILRGTLPAVRLTGVRAMPFRVDERDLVLVLEPAGPIPPCARIQADAPREGRSPR